MCSKSYYYYYISEGAFTPDANEALRTNDLHVKLMQRRNRQSCDTIRVNGANYAVRIECLTCHSRELKNLKFGGYSRRVNQSGACSSSAVITSGGRRSETTMEDKVIVVCGFPDLHIHLRTFSKTGIHFTMRLELPGKSPSHDAYSRLLCSEFHAQMKRVNSKCSSVQLRANSAIYSLHSRLV